MPRTASSPPLPTDQLVEDRREMIAWAEPVIADRVAEFYRVTVPGVADPDSLKVQHRQLWRSALMGHGASTSVSRSQLQRLGAAAGLPADFVDAVDQDVMEELVDIVLMRFQGSRATARRYSLVLLAAASHLGAVRAAG